MKEVKAHTSALFVLVLGLTQFAQAVTHSTREISGLCAPSHTVGPGDVLSKIIIARVRRYKLLKKGPVHIYGPKGLIRKVIALNGKHIANPNELIIGSEVLLPPELDPQFNAGKCSSASAQTFSKRAPKRKLASLAKSGSSCRVIYRVGSGQIISSIIKSRVRKYNLHLGSVGIYGVNGYLKQILRLNASHVHDLDNLKPGMEIIIPPDLDPELASAQCPVRDRKIASQRPVAVATAPVASASIPEEVPTSTVPTTSQTEIQSNDAYSYTDLKNTELSLGLGAFVSNGAIPAGYLQILKMISENTFLLGQIQGASVTYPSATPFGTLEGQFKVGVGKALDGHLIVGGGYRYFAFGFTNPSNTNANTNDLFGFAAYRTQLSPRMNLYALADLRMALLMGSNSTDTISAPPQFSGFGLQVEGRYLLNRNFFVGPYASVDSINLGWTQSGAFNGPNSFSAFDIGMGLHLGYAF